MSFSRGEKSNLSFRLRRLASLYQLEKYIWDIGCDHGQLGLSLIHRPEVSEVHLVDPSLAVNPKLIKTLEDSYITKAFFHRKRGQDIKISPSSNTIFIAGMGGAEIDQIIRSLLPQIDHSSRFIISPHRKILELRKSLRELPLKLEHEEVLLENGQFYQILALGIGTDGKEVSRFGEDLWSSQTGQLYREHQLKTFKVHRDEASLDYIQFLNSLKGPKITLF